MRLCGRGRVALSDVTLTSTHGGRTGMGEADQREGQNIT